VVNGFRLRCRQRIQSDAAHKTTAMPHPTAIAIDIPKLVAVIVIGPDHDVRRS
jgi:hypothetical protein